MAREVLVRIERCGLCHSDLHIQDGYADLGGGKRLDTTRGMTLPFTLGHEIAGVVEEVGPDASSDLIGKKKAVFPWIGCGQCRDCANGDENLCLKQRFLGVSIDGGFASHVLVPDAKYLLDYDPLPVNQAATLMCSGVTAYGALKRLVDRPRQRIIRYLVGAEVPPSGGPPTMPSAPGECLRPLPVSSGQITPILMHRSRRPARPALQETADVEAIPGLEAVPRLNGRAPEPTVPPRSTGINRRCWSRTRAARTARCAKGEYAPPWWYRSLRPR